jgi:signal transduction histidine kinase
MGFPGIKNPLAIQALEPVLKVTGVTLILLPICMIASAVSLVQRFRRSRGVDRLHLKWLAAASAAVAVGYVLFWLVTLPFGSDAAAPLWAQIVEFAALCSFVFIPIGAGIAILKHRLFDIDVVINKTVVFGVLAGFITAVYVAIVVGIGHVIGSANKPNLGLSILATAIVAFAFQPVRERVQRFANRLVYGQRATPYEVLSEFSSKVAETYATEEVLPNMARTVAEGTGAAHAEVWLRFHDQLRPAASWPSDRLQYLNPVSFIDAALPSFHGTDKAIAVRHQGELLGALTVAKPTGEPLNPAEEKLLTDLASQAGLVLRNVALTNELLVRLEELTASRQRLVTAQDQERRRLERNLHDGAQQNLVALKMRLALARRITEREPRSAEEVIGNLEQDADDALNTLRDFARGIYPPLLADQGLHAALEAQSRKAPVPVEVHSEGVSRYPQEIESAVYFCCLEAIQNISKYAHATRAVVMLEQREGELAFSITDDGVGFDPATTSRGSGTQNMVDRLEALEGTLTVESSVGKGTTVRARLPFRVLESAT